MAVKYNRVLMLSLLVQLMVRLSIAQFVFEFEVQAVTTNGLCRGFFDFNPDCETYLNRFCLRNRGHPRSLDDSDCPLSSSGRLGPDFSNLPASRVIVSDQSWPVSNREKIICTHLLIY